MLDEKSKKGGKMVNLKKYKNLLQESSIKDAEARKATAYDKKEADQAKYLAEDEAGAEVKDVKIGSNFERPKKSVRRIKQAMSIQDLIDIREGRATIDRDK